MCVCARMHACMYVWKTSKGEHLNEMKKIRGNTQMRSVLKKIILLSRSTIKYFFITYERKEKIFFAWLCPYCRLVPFWNGFVLDLSDRSTLKRLLRSVHSNHLLTRSRELFGRLPHSRDEKEWTKVFGPGMKGTVFFFFNSLCLRKERRWRFGWLWKKLIFSEDETNEGDTWIRGRWWNVSEIVEDEKIFVFW